MASSLDRLTFRTKILTNHLLPPSETPPPLLPSPCLNYTPPDLTNPFQFDTRHMRTLIDGHNLVDRDWLFGLMTQSKLFCPRDRGVGRVFVGQDYNPSMEQHREMTMKRIEYLLERGVFERWLTGKEPEDELRKLALMEVIGIFDHSHAIKLGVHFLLWCVVMSSLLLLFFSIFMGLDSEKKLQLLAKQCRPRC